jgi:hypothetical protein
MRTRKHIQSIVLLLVLFLAGAADFARGTDALVPCTRARLTTAPYGWKPIVGFIERADADSLIFRVKKDRHAPPYRLTWAEVRELETYAGRRSRPGRAAMLGLLTGASAGLIVGTAVIEPEGEAVLWPGSDIEAIGISVLSGAALGFFLGSVLGAIVQTDIWEPVRLPIVGVATDVGVSRFPTPAGDTGLGFVLRY